VNPVGSYCTETSRVIYIAVGTHRRRSCFA